MCTTTCIGHQSSSMWFIVKQASFVLTVLECQMTSGFIFISERFIAGAPGKYAVMSIQHIIWNYYFTIFANLNYLNLYLLFPFCKKIFIEKVSSRFPSDILGQMILAIMIDNDIPIKFLLYF